jgi:hypothetical protein
MILIASLLIVIAHLGAVAAAFCAGGDPANRYNYPTAVVLFTAGLLLCLATLATVA